MQNNLTNNASASEIIALLLANIPESPTKDIAREFLAGAEKWAELREYYSEIDKLSADAISTKLSDHDIDEPYQDDALKYREIDKVFIDNLDNYSPVEIAGILTDDWRSGRLA